MEDISTQAPSQAPAVTTAPHPLVALAKAAVETWVTSSEEVPPPEDMAEAPAGRAGVFVCLKDKYGALRGCIGTFDPAQANIALETIRNAIASATRDPRFPPVTASELPYLQYTVDVLTAPERVESEAALDPRHYGVIVQAGLRRGLLLPDLEGVDTVEAQVDIAKRKAGIRPRERVDLFRFTVQRFQ
ncbi:MAG: AmmeMemoRadiSam system protein A [Chloroflexi bacterium]|nr:AmmeMemoRadiSam system protein A [Chloroflexota bacterium]MCL5108799.1 AmmeMemoRadiSam system protein A [Chloroflexota bacterium]